VLKGVTSVGGTVVRVPGAVVRGAVTEVPYWGGARWDHPWGDRAPRWWRGWWYPMGNVWGFFWTLIKLGTLALLLAVVVLVAPRAVGRASLLAGTEWLKAGLAGLLAVVLYLPAVVLLCALLVVTIIGCLVVPLVVVAAVLLPFFIGLAGYAASALCLGRWLSGRLGWSWTSPVAHVVVGTLALAVLPVTAELIALTGPVLWPMTLLLDGLGFFVGLAATIVGIGALLLARSPRAEVPAAPAPEREEEPEPPAASGLAPIAVPPLEPAAGAGEDGT